ncbi:hypothetical protein [Salinimicrobium flavum]|uniref:Lipoprotein n=1 Tax=Salinimicrobium flavum TaxID=1737065 RepID=A0ABW5IUD3_9FLAO
MKKITLAFLLLIITSCAEKEEKSVVEKIAEAHGLDQFEEIEELRFTFNVKVNDSLRTSRAWTWNPKTNMVTLTTPDSTVTYNHKTEASENQQTDQRFINDQYWLLFPFHLVWDEMDWEHTEEATAPISGDSMQKVTVTYPDGAGYTPGDVYEIYFGDDHIIREWIYRSGGSTENLFPATWEGYKEFNGLYISTMHRNADGSFELFFTEVSIE